MPSSSTTPGRARTRVDVPVRVAKISADVLTVRRTHPITFTGFVNAGVAKGLDLAQRGGVNRRRSKLES